MKPATTYIKSQLVNDIDSLIAELTTVRKIVSASKSNPVNDMLVIHITSLIVLLLLYSRQSTLDVGKSLGTFNNRSNTAS